MQLIAAIAGFFYDKLHSTGALSMARYLRA